MKALIFINKLPVFLFCISIIVVLTSCKKEEDVYRYLVLENPNGSEKFYGDDIMEITYRENIEEDISIDLLCSNEVHTCITSNTASTGSYSWKIPSNIVYSGEYKIRITSTADADISDESNTIFSIGVSPNYNPEYITVIQPNGGETYTNGGVCHISWDTNLPLVKVYLTRGDYIVGEIGGNGTSESSISATINGFDPSTQYKIVVAKASDISMFDASDGYFTIKDPEL